MSEVLEGRVICGEEAAACVCRKDAGHEDGVHECLEGCRGAWRGAYPNDTFEIVRLPLAIEGRYSGG